MANEVSYDVMLSYPAGQAVFDGRGQFETLATSGARFASGRQKLSTSAEALNLGEVSAPGRIGIRNLSTTAAEIVNVRAGSGGADTVQIMPGATEVFRLKTATPYVVSESGTPTIEYFVSDK